MNNNPQDASFRKQSPGFFAGANAVVIYTAFSILRKMRKDLGLEAMLGYIEKYIALTDSRDPELKAAVGKALKLMSVEKIYREAITYENS